MMTTVEGYEGEGLAVRSQAELAQGIRAYYQSPLPAVVIPAVQSLVTGVSVGLTAGVLARVWGAPGWTPVEVGVSLGCLVQTLGWLGNVRWWRRKVDEVERLVGLDLNGDGQVGAAAEAERRTIRVEVSEREGQRVRYLEAPVEDERLQEFARGVVAGRGVAEETWTGGGKLFSKGEFRALRDVLMKRELAVWVNERAPTQSWRLTAAGRAVMRALASGEI